ncbi:MAG: carboxy terminal-processing peptidase [Pseudomonadota bacterium]
MRSIALPAPALHKALALFTLLLLVAAAPGWAGEAKADEEAMPAAKDNVLDQPLEALQPAQQHKKIVQVVTDLMDQFHYAGTEIDNALSSQILDGYIDALDGNKFYFLAQDIQRFERYRTTLDDSVRAGNVAPAFDVFNRYRQRVHERIVHAISLLSAEPNFTIDEAYYFDREDQPWAGTTAELDEIWRQRVKNDALSLMLTGKEWDGEDGVASTLRKRYERVLRRTSQLTEDEVFESFMNAYADTLDPHSNYFSPRNTEEYRIQMSLSYEGIGASLQLREDYVTVMNIIPGGPAAIDGSVEQKDRITAVGQGDEGSLVDVIGWRLDDVVELIRGPGGTTVRLQILPAGAAPGSAERIVALVRDEVRLEAQAAKRETLDIERGNNAYKVGVIKVPSFYQDYAARQAGRKDYTSTTRDVRRLIGELKEEGMDALIVDLRNNGGGHLWEARAMTGLFIDGPVVQFRETNGRVRQLSDIEPGVAYDGPLAVLVDRYSASASEIFAAAIQDYERGVVIGQNTFGKGSVQNLYDLNRWSTKRATGDMGQLTLTIGKYYRVTGGSTQLRGVAPDIQLPSPVDEDLVGESTRETALNWDQIDATRFRQGTPLDTQIVSLERYHGKRVADDPDFRLWQTEIEDLEEFSSRTSVSLNYDTRKAERDDRQQRRLALENERREALGMEALKDVEALEDVEPVDVMLHEAAEIITDYSSLSGLLPQRTAASTPGPSKAEAVMN